MELIEAVPDGALFKWGLYDRAPLDSWTLGRVAMVGDAAHPMTPFLGQGTAGYGLLEYNPATVAL
ncbi:MAG: hypothetical protein ACKV2O_07810 [Acidimicrobiales bacterium]